MSFIVNRKDGFLQKKTSLEKTILILSSALIFAALIKPQLLPAQETSVPVHNLSTILPDWYIVTGGNPLCAPVRTGYGFASLSEGKLLTAFSTDGKILWQRSYSFHVKPYLSSGLSDMLFLVTGKNGKTLTFLNPTGGIICSIDNPFEITSAPVQGKDGRIFVYGSDKAACYGLNGICKWIYEFDYPLDQMLKPVELNDGSQLFFLTRTIDGKTTGKRLSPFGQIFEDITFAARVKSYSQCRNGIILEFTDGSAGYCSVEKNTLESKWIFEQKNNIAAVCGNMNSENPCVFTKDNSRINFISEKDGSIKSSVKLEGYSFSSTSSADRINISEAGDGIFVNTMKKGTFISEGKIVYECEYEKNKDSLYLIPPSDGNIIFMSNDWSIKGWKVKQRIGLKKKKNQSAQSASYFDIEQKVRKRQVGELSSSWTTGAAADDAFLSQMNKAYSKGMYGEKEYNYHSLLKTELTAIENEYKEEAKNHVTEVSYFKSHASYTEQIIILSSLTGTSLFQKNISFMIRQIKDPALFRILITAAKNISFDENYSMLKAIYSSLSNFSPDEEGIYLEVCDAVLNICRYMGQESYEIYGKGILETLRYSGYSTKIQKQAARTLAKLADLNI